MFRLENEDQIIDDLAGSPGQDLEDLSQNVNQLVDVINQALETSAQEKEEQSKALAEQEQADQEQQKIDQQELEQQKQQEEEFRQSVLTALDELDQTGSNTEVKELLTEIKDQQALVLQMYNEVLPYVKYASAFTILFLCLVPLFMVVRWLNSMFNSAFR